MSVNLWSFLLFPVPLVDLIQEGKVWGLAEEC